MDPEEESSPNDPEKSDNDGSVKAETETNDKKQTTEEDVVEEEVGDCFKQTGLDRLAV